MDPLTFKDGPFGAPGTGMHRPRGQQGRGGGRVRLDAAGATRVGDDHMANEDQFLVAHVRPTLVVDDSTVAPVGQEPDEEALVLAVADGVGGAAHGDLASQEAIRQLAGLLRTHTPHPPPVSDDLEELPTLPDVRAELGGAFSAAHRRIRLLGEEQTATTLTVAYLCFPHLYVAHIGDSCCQLLRARSLRQLTHDHTMAVELRGVGAETVDELFEHVLTRALGCEQSPHEPEVTHWGLEEGDVVLLCSDGVTSVLEPQEVSEVLGSDAPSSFIANELVDRAQEWSGWDDATAVVARVLGEHPLDASGGTGEHPPGAE